MADNITAFDPMLVTPSEIDQIWREHFLRIVAERPDLFETDPIPATEDAEFLSLAPGRAMRSMLAYVLAENNRRLLLRIGIDSESCMPPPSPTTTQEDSPAAPQEK